jgi:hypothetical protein
MGEKREWNPLIVAGRVSAIRALLPVNREASDIELPDPVLQPGKSQCGSKEKSIIFARIDATMELWFRPGQSIRSG